MTNPTVIDELLPCPFCGGEPQELHRVAPKGTVCCLKCSAYTISTSDWNTRTKPEGVDIEEMLRKYLYDIPSQTFSVGTTIVKDNNSDTEFLSKRVVNEKLKEFIAAWHLTAKE